MQDKWTIELTSDQVTELLEAVANERNQLEYYPPDENDEAAVHEAHEHSVTVIEELIVILSVVTRKIYDELGVPR